MIVSNIIVDSSPCDQICWQICLSNCNSNLIGTIEHGGDLYYQILQLENLTHFVPRRTLLNYKPQFKVALGDLVFVHVSFSNFDFTFHKNFKSKF